MSKENNEKRILFLIGESKRRKLSNSESCELTLLLDSEPTRLYWHYLENAIKFGRDVDKLVDEVFIPKTKMITIKDLIFLANSLPKNSVGQSVVVVESISRLGKYNKESLEGFKKLAVKGSEVYCEIDNRLRIMNLMRKY